MLRRTVVLLCLAAIAFAKTPRPLTMLPIHTPEGKTIDLRKFKGKAMVLVIFSTSCDDCVAVIRLMDGIQKEYASQGLQVIGAAGDENARYLLAPFINRYRPTFPIGFLTKEEIIKLADVAKDARPVAPIVLFIDRWSTVRYQYYGNDVIFKDAAKNLRYMSLAMTKVPPAKKGSDTPPPPPPAGPKSN